MAPDPAERPADDRVARVTALLAARSERIIAALARVQTSAARAEVAARGR